jgi:hypothetical protein
MEERILGRMPEILLAVTVPAAACAVLTQAQFVAILALAVATAWGLSLIPLSLACLIVIAMKCPRKMKSPGHQNMPARKVEQS